MDIETVAKEKPDAIFVRTIDPIKGVTNEDLDYIIGKLKLTPQKE